MSRLRIQLGVAFWKVQLHFQNGCVSGVWLTWHQLSPANISSSLARRMVCWLLRLACIGSTHLASNWLADGRNIHQENFESRQLITSPRLPGYLEGVSLLPQKVSKPQTPKRLVVVILFELMIRCVKVTQTVTITTKRMTCHYLSPSVTPASVVALHNLPSRPVKPFSRLPHTCYRRSHETGQNVQASSLGGSLVWNRPRFSTLDQVKQLSGKLHSRQGVQSPSTKRL